MASARGAALFAEFRTKAAVLRMMRRQVEREVRTRKTALGAVGQGADGLGFCVRAAHHQTVQAGLQADRMAVKAVRDALAHRLIKDV